MLFGLWISYYAMLASDQLSSVSAAAIHDDGRPRGTATKLANICGMTIRRLRPYLATSFGAPNSELLLHSRFMSTRASCVHFCHGGSAPRAGCRRQRCSISMGCQLMAGTDSKEYSVYYTLI